MTTRETDRGGEASAPAREGGGRPVRPPAGWGTWTDRQLVFAGPDDREGAFAELFGRHAASVAAAARMILGPTPACDDVVTEVFTVLWCSPESFDPERGSLLGFLRLKARGRSIDLLRAESSRRRREMADVGHQPPEVPTAEKGFLAAETAQELRRAVASLPSSERTVIELAYFAGMTYRSVACHLGLPEGTVKSRIRSGIGRLRALTDSREWSALSWPVARAAVPAPAEPSRVPAV